MTHSRIGVMVLRIDADAVDSRGRANRQRVVNRVGGMTSQLYDEILALLPNERLRTRVTSNADAWESASGYIAAIGEDERDREFAASLPADGWLNEERRWSAAEARDAEREERLFRWHRPLVRLGALIVLDKPAAAKTMERMSAEFGGSTWLRATMMVVPGTPQMVEKRMMDVADETGTPTKT